MYAMRLPANDVAQNAVVQHRLPIGAGNRGYFRRILVDDDAVGGGHPLERLVNQKVAPLEQTSIE